MRRGEMVEVLRRSLPAGTSREIADSMTREIGQPVEQRRVYRLICYVRRNATVLHWTIPHVSALGGLRRYVWVPVDEELRGAFALPVDTPDLAQSGLIANVSHIGRRAGNDRTALKAIAALMRPSGRRAKVEELAEDMLDLRRKAARVIRFIEADDGPPPRAANGE